MSVVTADVSVGNAADDDRASLIFVDYVQRLRLKLFGHLRFVEASSVDATLAPCTRLPGYEAKIERIAQVDVVALDWNCPRHIPQRSCALDHG